MKAWVVKRDEKYWDGRDDFGTLLNVKFFETKKELLEAFESTVVPVEIKEVK